MKKIFYYAYVVLCVSIMQTSCESDKEFLKETRLDALNSGNAYLNKAQLGQLAASIYDRIRLFYNSSDGFKDTWILGLGTDVFAPSRDDASIFCNWALVTPVDVHSRDWYNWQYDIINKANTLIGKASATTVQWSNEAEKNEMIAEGRFLRAFAYRNLTNIFGGVPIIDTALTEPKVNFVRATRDECWQFAKADLEFARINLPLTTAKPGRVVKAAADHLLAEINICLKDWDGAIAAATRIIDKTDGDYNLMASRFGARAAEADKDVYYDLYVMGNQNYPLNKEAIWVAQFEPPPTVGGLLNFGRILTERIFWPNYWSGSANLGYVIQHDSTGRGVTYVKPTYFMRVTAWENGGDDMRANETNIKRNFYFGADVTRNGISYKKGQLIPQQALTTREDTMQFIFPRFAKFGTDKHIGGIPDNGYTRDMFIIRLAETYLLRAEAYIGKGNTASAVADVNAIRGRAGAAPATAAQMNIDYILDERARELFGDEYRMLTLGRLGRIYDRTKKLGYPASAASIQTKNNLMPIPQTAIDRNAGAKLEQNEGY